MAGGINWRSIWRCNNTRCIGGCKRSWMKGWQLRQQWLTPGASAQPERLPSNAIKPPKPPTYEGRTPRDVHPVGVPGQAIPTSDECPRRGVLRGVCSRLIPRNGCLMVAEFDRNAWLRDNPDVARLCLAAEAQFGVANDRQKARDELARLVQKTSVEDYTAKFMDLKTRIKGISDDECLDRYKRGLKPAVRLDVERANPLDLQHAMSHALKADDILFCINGGARNMNNAPVHRPLPGPAPRVRTNPHGGRHTTARKPPRASVPPVQGLWALCEGLCHKTATRRANWSTGR